MLTMKVICCFLLFGAVLADNPTRLTADNAEFCNPNHEDEIACKAARMGKNGEVPCQFIPGLRGKDSPSCVVDSEKLQESYNPPNDGRRSGNPNAWEDSVPPEDKFKRPSNEEILERINKVKTDDKELGNTGNAQVKRNFLFGPLLGLGGDNPFMKSFTFPECPVHVKYCYRVPCGGYYDRHLESSPKRCLSDPRCCYDYKLGYLKKIFGPKFMGGTPSCYYGATSKQWVYITKYFRPWNPHYTKFILTAFEAFFNTNAYDIGGKFACKSSFRRKAYPVGAKSKLQCNLVSGCWDEDLPEGHQCLMASEVIQKLFGRAQVYPSLFTNDPSDTKCSANWYEYGAKAYKRLPCGVGPSPLKFHEIFTDWCPIQECCVNYAKLGKDEKSQFMSYYMLMQGFGGSGFSPFGASPAHGLGHGGVPDIPNPFGGGWQTHGQQTPFDPKIFYYLLSSGKTDMTDLFCPYKVTYGAGIFPDISEDAEGCCDIPKCYHKKKLVRPAYPYPYPYPPTPTYPPTRPPVQAMWGAWGECMADCGTYGVRYRKCYVGHRQKPGLCPGHASEKCQGKPCPIHYRWGQFTPSGPCSRTCGGGYRTYERLCHGNGKVVDAYHCNGSPTKSDTCSVKPCEPAYRWSDTYAQLGRCSVTCGQGYAIWGRQCVSKSGQVVHDRYCPGDSRRQSRACVQKDCPARAEWGNWYPVTECGATCGPRGLRVVKRHCYVSGQKTASSACGGEDEKIERCAAPDCPMEYYWTGYIAEPCRRDPGGYCSVQRTRERKKRCYELVNGRYQFVSPQSRCGPSPTDTIPCNPQECTKEHGGY